MSRGSPVVMVAALLAACAARPRNTAPGGPAATSAQPGTTAPASASDGTRAASAEPAAPPSLPNSGATAGMALLFGTVRLREGDCMPGPAPPPGSDDPNPCRARPVATAVHAYRPPIAVALGSPDQTYPDTGSPAYSARSNAAGRYELRLPPGRYSILPEDDGRPWCNSFVPEGDVVLGCPVEVEAGQRLEHDLTINHAFD